MKKIIFIMIVFLFSVNIVNNHNLKYLEEPFKNKRKKRNQIDLVGVREVTVTMYNPVPGQTDTSPYITADLSQINKNNPSGHKWIAISYNLHTRYGGYLDFGDSVYLYGTRHKDGMYIVKDLMNPRFNDRIDILESIGVDLYKFKNCIISNNKIGDRLVIKK